MRFIRIAVVFFRAVFRQKIGALDESVLKLRVWPNEADVSNVSQSVYPLYMELGRWDWVLRVGLAKVMWKERCIGLLGGQAIQFLKPLKRFQAFTLRSRFIGWDEKWSFFEQKIESEGRLYAVCHARIVFIGRDKKRVTPSKLSAIVGGPVDSPPIGNKVALLESYFDFSVDSTEKPVEK